MSERHPLVAELLAATPPPTCPALDRVRLLLWRVRAGEVVRPEELDAALIDVEGIRDANAALRVVARRARKWLEARLAYDPEPEVTDARPADRRV